ncbi:MAG: UDP-N-acetylglucosamine 2-epimerase (hydrolyzing) [Candidatus Brocadia sp. WS118]|nr:MAG: UDP-N-acetylglucosamine 2-epimerase (hydrolyzing) [Candidatus Brocadia sp. WS118]
MAGPTLKRHIRKIGVITGTRAEFGLMYWLIKEIQEDPELELQLIVTGMHLSPEFGLTYREIENAAIPIAAKIEVVLSSDTAVGISKSMGLGMISFSEAFERLNPDIVVVLGDRFEIFSAAAAAMISQIPIAHIHGGEATEGLIDEPIRHSISKMAHLHFTATETYRKRVIQLGESPERVFNTGTPGLDNITKLQLLNRQELEQSLNFKLGSPTFLVTFHPVTLEADTASSQFEELLAAIDHFPAAKVIFTKPNADTFGRSIITLIDNYVKQNPEKAVEFISLGQLRYLSALSHVDIVIGNSSSGLTEAPTFKVPTINIGDRQRGRIKAASVIDANPKQLEIVEAINKALSESFQQILPSVMNPYGEGGASWKIKNIIKSFNLEDILKKSFHDLN